jgi:hypothetical protein
LKKAIECVLRAVKLIKPAVEVVAILVAGWWTYSRFIKIDEPALKENFGFESTLAWHPSKDASSCVAEDHFKITNQSKSPVDVRRVLRRAWYVERPVTERGAGITYFDPMEQALTTKPADEHWYGKNGPFVQTYPPGASSDYSFEWSVENRPNTYVLVRLDLYADSEAKELLDLRYDWGPPCDNQSQSIAPEPPEQSHKRPEPTTKKRKATTLAK